MMRREVPLFNVCCPLDLIDASGTLSWLLSVSGLKFDCKEKA